MSERERIYFVRLGASAPPLAEQFQYSGLDLTTIEVLQKDADAITRLAVRGLIPEGVKCATEAKLVKRIRKAIAKAAESDHAE